MIMARLSRQRTPSWTPIARPSVVRRTSSQAKAALSEPVVANRACHCEGGVNGGRTGCVCGAHAMRACHFADADSGLPEAASRGILWKYESFGGALGSVIS
jgi:hypothetical protein